MQIDVALRFYGNSSLGYKSPITPSDTATRMSLVFNPSNTTGLMLHSTPNGEGQGSLSVYLKDGSVGLGSIQLHGNESQENNVNTSTGVVQEDTWYQLFATQ